MSKSAILAINQIAETQNNKYLTHNDAVDILEESTNALFENAAVGAGPVTLTEVQATQYQVYKVSGGSAAFDLVFPSTINAVNAVRHATIWKADTTWAVTVKMSTGAGTTVTLTPGQSAVIQIDYEDVVAMFTGDTAQPPYDVGLYIPGTPGDGAEVFKFVAVRGVEWADDWAGSYGHIGVNPSDGANVFTIKKNGSSVGSISISTGGVFTFATTGAETSLVAGDRLTIENQGTADSTAADIGFNLKGYRV
jgi:hypothetical protein